MPPWLPDRSSFPCLLKHLPLFLYVLHLAASDQVLHSLSDPDVSPVHKLDLSAGLTLSWRLDYPAQQLSAQVSFDPALLNGEDETGHDRDWLAVGFSKNGSLSNADLCIFWTDWKGQTQLTDTHTDASGRVIVDPHQDCQAFRILSNDELDYSDDDDDDSSDYLDSDDGMDGGVRFRFQRLFDTCNDDEDYVIEEGTTHVVFASGKGPLFKLDGLNVENDVKNGFVRVRLLAVEDLPVLPDDSFNLDVSHSVELPDDDTTYWCSVHKLPEGFRSKHHVVQYEPIQTPGNEHLLHHMEVFHCNAPADERFPLWSGPCGADTAPKPLLKCKKVLAAWAIGAGPFTYPEEAGLAIGGEDFNPYIMLEVHINNEKKEKGEQ